MSQPVNLYRPDVDLSTVDNLVSGTLAQMKVVAVEIPEGTETLLRGNPLTSTDGVTFRPIAANTDAIMGILLNDVDATNEYELGSAAVAFGGEFNQRKIEEVLDRELTPLQVNNARMNQLFIAPMNPAPTVDGSEEPGGGW